MLDPRIVLRPATLADVPVLEHWDRQPHVIAAASDVTTALEDLRWPDELAAMTPLFQYWIAELSGRPIGVMGIQVPDLEPTHYWGDIEPNLRSLDIWIGEANELGKGHGESMMRRAFQMCFAPPEVTAIVIDPLATNVRAHAFYRRLGFVAEGPRTFGEDHCLVHRLSRAVWRAHFPND
jgi:aminoglycoside 6'-N-acetyltransferase